MEADVLEQLRARVAELQATSTQGYGKVTWVVWVWVVCALWVACVLWVLLAT